MSGKPYASLKVLTDYFVSMANRPFDSGFQGQAFRISDEVSGNDAFDLVVGILTALCVPLATRNMSSASCFVIGKSIKMHLPWNASGVVASPSAMMAS